MWGICTHAPCCCIPMRVNIALTLGMDESYGPSLWFYFRFYYLCSFLKSVMRVKEWLKET